MHGLSLSWTLLLGIPALVVQTVAVAFARALTTYSRNRLEEVCEERGVPDRAALIDRHGEWIERSAEALALLGVMILAALVGAHMVSAPNDGATRLTGLVILCLAVIGQVAAGAAGRVWAETLLGTCWPAASVLRILAWPLTAVTLGAEWVALRLAGESDQPRPTSVEVEIEPDADHPEADESELPDATREMLERVVSLSRRDVSEIMKPRSAMLELSAEVSAADAARAFRESGFSRIPLFGESRDDIVGVLYSKDLFPAMVGAETPARVVPRKLARPAHLVPESKNAAELLDELRAAHLHIAIVVDEYGAVSGLVTFEDLIEELVGPVTDEHDKAPAENPIVALGDSRYEVDASLSLEEINERLDLSLPTDGDFETVGGLAFHILGRLPEPGATFEYRDVGFTVAAVADHSIRRLRIDLAKSGAVG